MNVLFLSHCVPYPPDKGEKIRAFRELDWLCDRFRVHLACFARTRGDGDFARQISSRCASVYVEPLRAPSALACAAARFALGGSLTGGYFASRRMKRYVDALARSTPLSAAVVYTAVMMPFAPEGVPAFLDLVDFDSEKWLDYSRTRRPGFLYGWEGRRFRALELAYARRAGRAVLSTEMERELFESFAGPGAAGVLPNGVDTAFFDPARCEAVPELRGRRLLTFVGTMDYYPNVDAAEWFAARIFPALRQRDPRLEFVIVGRNPAEPVRRLASQPGITVTGGVPDVRPYLAASLAVVAPLRIARGIQNKVLEALSMGRTVLASEPICRTFGSNLPAGLVPCRAEGEFIEAALAATGEPAADPRIRAWVERHFSWDRSLAVFAREFEGVLGGRGVIA